VIVSDDPAIELDGVVKVYPGEVRALDGVTFRVQTGEHCCLLGPNGAGKTTIIRLLEGAVTPTSGRISLMGKPAYGSSLLQAKGSIGVVPQNPGLYPDLTVLEYLEFVRSLYGRGRPAEVAGEYGLAQYLNRPLSTLSGGYQRRLLVAAAVLSEPSLLLLDEPTVGLDPLAAADTRRLLREAMEGRTVMMSTHNLAEAEELCDTVIIIRQGVVLIHERIEDLRRQAAPRVHVQARQEPWDLTRALHGMGLQTSPNGAGVWLHIDEPERHMPGVLRGLLDAGIDVYESRIIPPTLEDLFVQAVTTE
jgi:ABC-2 type transport system ATP-binding protein